MLQAIEQTLQSANKILKRDLGVELQLISENKKLIFLDPDTDQLTGNNAHILINEIPSRVNELIAVDSYDLAHAFFNRIGGLSVVKGAFGKRKAQAVSGALIPEGKTFDVDLFTHEVGHQLGATHTQNSNCSRNLGSSVEPGSGSTIIGYAGVCRVPKSNVRFTSQPYFHEYNIQQVKRFLNIGKEASNKNTSYGLEAIPNYNIPKGTPFEIFLKGAFPSNAIVEYSCNQVDKEIAAYPPAKDQVMGPVFSAQVLSKSKIHSFPEKELIINGNFNSAKGVLSNVPRAYHFVASARAEFKNQFLTSLRKFKVNVVDIPAFKVNSQDEEQLIWEHHTKELITWEVGETKQQLKIDYVDILLSDNNGKSFDHILASKVANNGEYLITVPNTITSNNCRIKVKATNSIFYALNLKRFSITPFYEITTKKEVDLSFKNEIASFISIEKELDYKNIEVGVALSYSDVSKLKIALYAPNGREIVLWDRFCSQGTNLDVRFKDNEFQIPKGKFKSTAVCDSLLLGFRAPEEALSDLDSNTGGDWKLVVTNTTDSENFGKLKKWSLHFIMKGAEKDSKKMDFNENVIVYPNPVQNKLGIRLNKMSTESIRLELFSVIGELKLAKIIPANKKFEIEVESLPSGVYFLKMRYGKNVVSKKIVKN